MLVGILLIIAALILWAAYRNGWDWRATVAALAAFIAAIWQAFVQLGTPSP